MWIMLTKKLPTKISPPKMSIFWAVRDVNWSTVLEQFTEYLFGNIDISRTNASLVKQVVAEDAQKHRTTANRDRLSADEIGLVAIRLEEAKRKSKKTKKFSLSDYDEERLDYFKRKYANFCALTSCFDSFGESANETKTLKIFYKGETIRVLAHEYNVINDDHMKLYIFGEKDMPADTRPSHEFVQSEVAENSLLFNIKNPSPEVKEIIEAIMLDGCTIEQARAVVCGYDIFNQDATKFEKNGWYRCQPEYAKVFCSESEMEE